MTTTVDPLRSALDAAAALDDADADLSDVLGRVSLLLGRVTERTRRGGTVSTLLHAIVACAIARKRYDPSNETSVQTLAYARNVLTDARGAAQAALAQDEECLGYQTWRRIAARKRTYGPRYGYIDAPSL